MSEEEEAMSFYVLSQDLREVTEEAAKKVCVMVMRGTV
jgi:hypothetical protein